MAPKCNGTDVKEAPGHKIWEDSMGLVPCGNAARHIGENIVYVGYNVCQFQTSAWESLNVHPMARRLLYLMLRNFPRA
jgi:hypothetical protein